MTERKANNEVKRYRLEESMDENADGEVSYGNELVVAIMGKREGKEANSENARIRFQPPLPKIPAHSASAEKAGREGKIQYDCSPTSDLLPMTTQPNDNSLEEDLEHYEDEEKNPHEFDEE